MAPGPCRVEGPSPSAPTRPPIPTPAAAASTALWLARLLTAARFIKARMPLGEPTLTNDEAFDVAGYINAQPRPQMENLEQDYPKERLQILIGSDGVFSYVNAAAIQMLFCDSIVIGFSPPWRPRVPRGSAPGRGR